ncbi:ABC transporter permease [Solibacillus sp. FSL H8-0523]|uniref:ABC transporter permease n=1 Tax=Solibacillus sp. FSL H8-0523 TaxID=2954511 RepID=UPI003101A7A8
MEKLANSNRIFLIPIIAVLILGLIFMSSNIPTVKMNPKDLPIGLVVSDEGEMGATLSQALLANAPEAVKFTEYESVDALKTAMDEREAYGALVIPTDFSSKLATLQTPTPEKATMQIYINEGANATVATIVQTALTTMVSMMNTNVSTQMLTAVGEKTEEMKENLAPILAAQGENSPLAQVGAMISPIAPDKVHGFANPIQSEIVKVHEVNGLASVPAGLLTAVWFSSLIGAVMLFLAGNKRIFATKANKLKFNTLQSILPFVYAIVGGYVITWYSTWILGFEYASFHKVALFVSLAIATFIFMIFATLRWLKLPSIILYVLMMFFSMAAVQLAPEMVPDFYRDYIISWLPLRFFVEGLKDVLFFTGNVFNEYGIVLVWILVVALVLVWIKNLVEKQKAA